MADVSYRDIHHLSAEETLIRLRSSQGSLSLNEARQRLGQYGRNVLHEVTHEPEHIEVETIENDLTFLGLVPDQEVRQPRRCVPVIEGAQFDDMSDETLRRLQTPSHPNKPDPVFARMAPCLSGSLDHWHSEFRHFYRQKKNANAS